MTSREGREGMDALVVDLRLMAASARGGNNTGELVTLLEAAAEALTAPQSAGEPVAWSLDFGKGVNAETTFSTLKKAMEYANAASKPDVCNTNPYIPTIVPLYAFASVKVAESEPAQDDRVWIAPSAISQFLTEFADEPNFPRRRQLMALCRQAAAGWTLRAPAASHEGGQDSNGWLPMVSAPLDGTEIDLLIRHRDYWPAFKVSGKDIAQRDYEGVCRGHWIDHNGGGWTWHGLAGYQIGWRPLPRAIRTAEQSRGGV